MSDQNILVSSGTCYSAAGKKLDGSFIPCGNDAFGHQTCCGAGDNCLADNSCFGVHGSGYGSSLTYMAGCTDPDYKDKSCPDKHIDQEWIALTLCDNSDGAWAPCSQEGDPSTLQPGSFCSCTDAAKTTVAFKDATVIPNIASLPRSSGQSIAFVAGHTPSGDPTAPASSGTSAAVGSSGSNGNSATASQTGSNGASANVTPMQTGSNASSGASGSRTSSQGPSITSGSSPGAGNSGTASQSYDGGSGTGSGLASGAKIGIGVGVALGALLLLGALALLLFRRRRRTRSTLAANEAEVPSRGAKEDKKLLKPVTTPPVPEVAEQPVTEVAADGQAAQPWSMRSELEGTHPYSQVIPPATQHPGGAVLANGAPGGYDARPLREGATEMDTTVSAGVGAPGITQQQYISYRPPQQVAELPAVRTPPEEGNTRLG